MSSETSRLPLDELVTPGAVTAGEPNLGRSTAITLNIAAATIAALYFGKDLLIPLVLASMLAFVLAPACSLLERFRFPKVVAVLLVVLVAFGVMGGVATVVGRQVGELTQDLPRYQDTVLAKWHELTAGGDLLQKIIGGLAPSAPHEDQSGPSGPGSALGLNGSGFALARTFALPLLSPLATAGIVLVFTIFMLLARNDLRDRFVRLVGRRDLHRTILAMNDAGRRLSRYFLFQLGLNSGFGALIGTSLWFAGLPGPALWGILAAIMRFVPFIGTFIALAPPLLLAFAVVPGWTLAFIVLALFLCAELLMGQAVEPLVYGHSTGLSPIAVIIATAFWALLWGPVGLLLATPLTVCLVVLGRHVEPLAFLDVVLGDTPPLTPAETFYQRVLEGNLAELERDARRQIGIAGMVKYYDDVALSGLALAQRDLARDALAFERLEHIHARVDELLGRLETRYEGMAAQATRPGCGPDGAILCIAARGQLDDLAATMATQVLADAGFGATIKPNAILGAGAGLADFGKARLCCLSVFEEGSSPAGIQYFARRIQKQMPAAVLVICLWRAQSDSALLAALRSSGQQGHVVLSLGELVTLSVALADRATRTVRQFT